VFDAVLVQDSPAVQPLTISIALVVFDSVHVQEGQTDSTTLLLSVIDTVTLTESVSITMTRLNITANEVVTVLDVSGVFASGPLGAIGIDTVTVQEFIGRYLSLYITANDNVAVVDGALNMTVFEAVTVIEDVTVKLARLLIAVNESVTVTEDVELFGTAINSSVFEEIVVDESVTLFLPTLAPACS
jgi:hypothetical protein